jgi:flagellar biosynthesis/type III secretory pathway protein FliH
MTAVQWLISQLNKKGFAQVVTDEEIEQAKQMEETELEHAYDQGHQDGYSEGYNEGVRDAVLP